MPSGLIHRALALAALLVAPLSLSAFAVEQDIRFGINAAPPFHIPISLREEFNTPPGFCDALVTAIERHLPDADIERVALPHIRIRRLMKRQEKFCFPCLIKRSSYNPDYYFSDTVNLYSPHGVITRRALGEQLIERYGSPLPFEALAQENQFSFAQPSGRKYGDLQPILDRYLLETPRHNAVFGDNAVFNLLSMIAADRIDYTIDYEMMIHFYQQLATDANSTDLIYIPIKEYQQRSVTGAVGCARNAWGKRAIERINSVLPEVTSDPEFQRSLDFWLGSERLRDAEDSHATGGEDE